MVNKPIEEKLKELKEVMGSSNKVEVDEFLNLKEYLQNIRNKFLKLLDEAIEKTENDKKTQAALKEIKGYTVNPKEELGSLEESITTQSQIEVDRFLEFEKHLRDIKDRFIDILEYALDKQGSVIKRDAKEQEEYNKLRDMLRRLKAQNISQLMDDVGREGYRIGRMEELREAFEKSAYRILELTRAGRRSDVFYNIVRIFIARGVNMPPKLQEVFKPHYDLQTFQALMYAFLVSILKEDKNQNQEESYE